MENDNYSQLELFSQGKTCGHAKNSPADRSFLAYIRNYEKILLIIIAFIVTVVISFSLGVEKERRNPAAALKAQPAAVETALKPAKTPPQPVIEKQNLIQEEPGREYINNYYTIQVASFQNRKSAEKEAEALKKRGLSPSIVSKGKYSVVYVGNFPSKKTAESLLAELKKRYGDCLIRRL